MRKRQYLIIKERAEWWDLGVGGRSKGWPYVRPHQSSSFAAPEANQYPSSFKSLSAQNFGQHGSPNMYNGFFTCSWMTKQIITSPRRLYINWLHKWTLGLFVWRVVANSHLFSLKWKGDPMARRSYYDLSAVVEECFFEPLWSLTML